jgi:hypothetical protein
MLMSTEDILAGWTGPSSDSEQDKQSRTERMIREAIRNHSAFDNCSLSVYAKGSYANNTNVRADSDVDIAVQCHDVQYWGESPPGAHPPGASYAGIWTPSKLRAEVGAALRAKFPREVDGSGATAFGVNSSSARVDADVVPCFDYRYYFGSGGHRDGTRVFRKDGSALENYPAQQLEYGKNKNIRTNTYYKKAVRILKRCGNKMVAAGVQMQLPSFFIECLGYNCPDDVFLRSSWTETVRGMLVHIWNGLEGSEPAESAANWREANECKYLFTSKQSWTRADGRAFAKAAWNYLGYKS